VGLRCGRASYATRSRLRRPIPVARTSAAGIESADVPAPRLEIAYCRQCRWLLRAAWLAQELLTSFEAELGEVALVPGTGGVFEVRLDGEVLFSRASEGRFPEARELKQKVRDRVAPGRELGHSERPLRSGEGE
jgi:selenoprotein W-related protein